MSCLYSNLNDTISTVVFLYACSLFLINHPATPNIYTLSLHDALPIFDDRREKRIARFRVGDAQRALAAAQGIVALAGIAFHRSEEHTSELQSLRHLVCRLLLEKKKCVHL